MSMENNPPVGLSDEMRAELAIAGWTYEELVEAASKREIMSSRTKSRWVCMCGHSVGSHIAKGLSVGVTCTPNRRICHCGTVKPILEASNLRFFNRFSDAGNGVDHALSAGVQKLLDSGGTIQWDKDKVFCAWCQIRGVKMSPTVINKPENTPGITAIEKKSGLTDILLCVPCESKFQAYRGFNFEAEIIPGAEYHVAEMTESEHNAKRDAVPSILRVVVNEA